MNKVVKGSHSENVPFEERPGWEAREEVCVCGRRGVVSRGRTFQTPGRAGAKAFGWV